MPNCSVTPKAMVTLAWLASLEATATHSSTNAFELGKWMAKKLKGPGLAFALAPEPAVGDSAESCGCR